MSAQTNLLEMPEIGTTSKEIYSGFSNRLNEVIDMAVDLHPPQDHGRIQWLADILQTQRGTPKPWLKDDTPPKIANNSTGAKTTTLVQLVTFLLANIEGGSQVKPQRLIGYLLFGPEHFPNPLNNEPDSKYQLVATGLVLRQGVKAGLSAEKVEMIIDNITVMLKVHNCTNEEEVPDIVRTSVSNLIELAK